MSILKVQQVFTSFRAKFPKLGLISAEIENVPVIFKILAPSDFELQISVYSKLTEAEWKFHLSFDEHHVVFVDCQNVNKAYRVPLTEMFIFDDNEQDAQSFVNCLTDFLYFIEVCQQMVKDFELHQGETSECCET